MGSIYSYCRKRIKVSLCRKLQKSVDSRLSYCKKNKKECSLFLRRGVVIIMSSQSTVFAMIVTMQTVRVAV